ncbi:MAG: dUTP diphosphatase [Flavobacteriales bacterium]|nr:dUTP diphosphatase [Flavobacteriales bacterium]
MEVKIVNNSGYPLPTYETIRSAGVDLRSATKETVVLMPGERQLISTGLFIALPHGTEAQIRPRSGLAFKKGLTVLNAPGTVDADYRGEVKVLLVNLGQENCAIEPGDRIAQMVFARYEQAKFMVTAELDQTSRGEGGFGSTGTK